MSSVNKVILVGNVGRDAEVQTTQNGAKFAKFSIATTEKYTTSSGEKKETTEWHNIVVWGNQADVAGQWVKKGRQIYVEGKLQSSEWEDKNGGGKRKGWDINASSFQLLGSKPEGSAAAPATSTANANATTAAPVAAGGNDNDDLPF